MAEEDVILTYDPNPFLAGVQKTQKALYDFSTNAGNTLKKFISKIPIIGKKFSKQKDEVKKSNKDMQKNISKGFTNMALKAVALVGALGLIKKAINAIPEIGLTFQAVGKILSKNLLWPLRQELIPLLQGVLDWTRKNRGMFLKWGGVIVNIFRAAKVLIKGALNLIKALTNSLMKSLGVLTKFAGKDITNIINIIVFKLTALFALLEVKLEPIFSWMGKNLGEMAKGFGEFFKELKDIGMLDKFFSILKGLGTLLTKVLINAFDRFKVGLKLVTSLLKGFFKGMAKVKDTNKYWEAFVKNMSEAMDLTTVLIELIGDKLAPAFEKLGEVIGKLVGETFKFLISILEDISEAIAKVLEFAVGKLTPKEDKKGGKFTKVDDAIISPNGNVVQTNPKDTLVALKDPKGSVSELANNSFSKNTNTPIVKKDVSFGEMRITLNITEGNSKQAGINFAEGIQDKMRQAIMDDFVRGGGR